MPPPIPMIPSSSSPSPLLKAVVQCRHLSSFSLLPFHGSTTKPCPFIPSNPPTLLICNRLPTQQQSNLFIAKRSPGAASWRWMRAAAGGQRIRTMTSSPTSSSGSSTSSTMINGGSGSNCREQQQQQRPKLLNLPTLLTIGRVAAVPFLVSVFYMNGWWATTATTSIFIAAAVTDWLDGYIARRMRLGTAFGAFLDPVADKLMVAAALVLLCTRPLDAPIFEGVPWLLAVPSIAIIGREITMSAVREWAASQNSKVLEAVAVNNLGKWKTATQMTALTILIAARDSSLSGQNVIVASGVALLYISSGLAVWSLYVYMRNIWRILLK